MDPITTLAQAVGRVEGQVTFLVEKITPLVEDHETRLRKVETRWAKVTGGFLILAVLIGGAWKGISALMN